MHDVGRTMDGKRLVAIADAEFEALVTIRGRLTALRADMDALLEGLPGVLMGTGTLKSPALRLMIDTRRNTDILGALQAIDDGDAAQTIWGRCCARHPAEVGQCLKELLDCWDTVRNPAAWVMTRLKALCGDDRSASSGGSKAAGDPAVNGGGATGSKAKGKPKKGGKVARSGKRRASPGGVATVRKADVAALLGDEPLPVKVLYERFLVATGAVASPALFKKFGVVIASYPDEFERVSRGVYRRRGASPAAAAAASPAAGPTPAPAVSGSGRALKAEKAPPPAMDRAARLPLLKEVDARVRARHEGG